jgi:hypothetical protein
MLVLVVIFARGGIDGILVRLDIWWSRNSTVKNEEVD